MVQDNSASAQHKQWLSELRMAMEAASPHEADREVRPKDGPAKQRWQIANLALKRLENGGRFWNGPTGEINEHNQSVEVRSGLLQAQAARALLALGWDGPDTFQLDPRAAARILHSVAKWPIVEPHTESWLADSTSKVAHIAEKHQKRKELADKNARATVAKLFSDLNLPDLLRRLDTTLRPDTGSFASFTPHTDWASALESGDRTTVLRHAQAWSAAAAAVIHDWIKQQFHGDARVFVAGSLKSVRFRIANAIPTELKALKLRFNGDAGLCTLLDPDPQNMLHHWQRAAGTGLSFVDISVHHFSQAYSASYDGSVYYGRNRNHLILCIWLHAMGPAGLEGATEEHPEGPSMPHTSQPGIASAELPRDLPAAYQPVATHAIALASGSAASAPKHFLAGVQAASQQVDEAFEITANRLSVRLETVTTGLGEAGLASIVIPWKSFGAYPAEWFNTTLLVRHQGQWHWIDIDLEDLEDEGTIADEALEERALMVARSTLPDDQFVDALRKAIPSGRWAYQPRGMGVFAALAVDLDAPQS